MEETCSAPLRCAGLRSGSARCPGRRTKLQLSVSRAFSPALSVWNPGKCARAFSRSSTFRSVGVSHCTHTARHQGQTAARPGYDRAFCETRRCKTLLAGCDGKARRCHWSAATWLGCGSGRCSLLPGRADIRGITDCHSIPYRGLRS